MKKELMITLILLIIAIFSGTVSAVDTSNGDLITNNTTYDSNNFTGNLDQSTINIQGNVTRCTNGQPFQGVTVTVNSSTGTPISQTTSDQNGFYQLVFSSIERNFTVTASHPGHMTVTKQVTVQQNSNDSNFNGFANFQLGPIPTLAIDAPSDQFLNESFNFHLNFINTGNETGFGPMVELILPPQIQYQSGSFLGITLNPWVGVFGPSGTLTNPFTNLLVTGTPGSTLYIFQQPLGSFTPGQPTATVDVTALLLGNSTLGAPLNITGTPIFRYGANETGTISIVGTSTTVQVTPTVIKLIKTSSAPEAETATGENYKRTYTLTVDVANGQTVNNLYVTDVIPGNLQYVSSVIPTGSTRTLEPSTTIPGGILQFHFSSITGIIGPDEFITYVAYAPRFDNLGQPVLSNVTGLSTNATNLANVTGNYSNINVTSNANYTLTLKSLAIQKGVTDITGGPNSPKPTDILKWDLAFQVSDYFGLKNLVLYDTLGDGQSFLDWPTRNSTYTPSLSINLPGITISNLLVDLSNLNQFTYLHNSTTGITYLFFNISQILIDNGYTGGTGIIYGANNSTGYYGATAGNLTFWSQIQPYYEGVNPGFLHPIVSNDPIVNNVRTEGQLLNNNTVSDGAANGVIIVAPSVQKNIIYINGIVPVGPPYVIQPGDNVTFSLQVNVPTSSLHQFNLIDYLPIPFFRATQFTTGQAQNTALPIPAAGQWRLSATDTLSMLTGVIPSLVVDASQNVLRFNYGNVSNSTQPNSIVNILFTVTATGDPMVDGLYLTNLLNVNYENSPGRLFTDNKVVWVQTGQPLLNINKTATSTTNLQAGDVVTYNILINNSGHAPAYNVVVKDNLLLGNPGYISSISSITAKYVNGTVITGLNLMDLFTADGLNFTALYPIFVVNGTNNTINITYNAILNGTVYPRQFINNIANITQYTSLPLPGSPNYVTSPISGSASVQVRDVKLNKSFISSLDGVSSGSNLTIGERGLFRLAVTLPAGQIHNLNIRDSLPAGLSYLSYALDLTGYSGNLSPLTFTQTGNILNFTFLGATNTTANSTFYINLTVLMDDNATANSQSPYNQTKTNNASLDWADPGHSVVNASADVNLLQPHLNIIKTLNKYTYNAGETATVTITLQNNGASPANNVILYDPLNPTLFDWSTITEGTTPLGYTWDPTASTTGIVKYTGSIPLNNGAPLISFIFTVKIRDDVPSGSTFRNTANTNYTSLPSGGRNYTNNDFKDIRTTSPGIIKSIIDHSEPATLLFPPPFIVQALIGEVFTYQISVNVPKGRTFDVMIVDDLEDIGLGYIIGSATWNIPLGVTTTYYPPFISYSNGYLSYDFGDINNTNSGISTIILTFKAVVMNIPSNQRGTSIPNRANIRYEDASGTGHSIFTDYMSVIVNTPGLSSSKTPSTTTAQGGDTITFHIHVTNGNFMYFNTAYNLEVNDPILSDYQNFTVVSITPTGSGIICINNSTSTLLDVLINKLSPGEYVDIYYTVKIRPDVNYGKLIQNTVTFTGNSIPLPQGTTGQTPGAPGTTTGVRTGSGTSPNDIRSTSNAIVTCLAPTISKTVDGIKTVTRTIGETATESIVVSLPIGTTTELKIIDVLPAGLLASGFTNSSTPGININQFIVTNLGGNTYEINFGNVTVTQPGNLTINYTVLVQNVPGNYNGLNMINNATLYYRNITGQSVNAGSDIATIRVIEPNIIITKSANPTIVDGGDDLQINLTANNNGFSPAYQLIITDNLDPNLFDSSFSYTTVPGFSFIRNVNTVTITANSTTSIAAGASQVFTFFLKVLPNVVTNSTFTNLASIQYSSLPPGFNETRNYTNSSNVVNITTTTPSMFKVLDSTSEPDSTANNVFIGEVVTYRLNLTVPEGKTLNVVLQDILPSNLQYNTGTARISRSNAGITSNFFDFSIFPVGSYGTITPSSPLLTFNLGNITNDGATGLLNGTISLTFNATVLNIIANQNGTQIPNSATFNFTNSSGNIRSVTSNCPDTLNVLVPKISTTKTAVSQDQDTITFNVIVRNDNITNGGPAYNLQVLDPLTGYKNLQIISIIPSSGSIIFTNSSTPNLLNITINQLNQTQFLNITYNATFNQSVAFGQQVNNTVNFKGTTIPGDHGTNNATSGDPGTPEGKRTGQNGSTGLNNIFATSTVTVTSRTPSISKNADGQKTVTHTIGENANETIVVSLPIGTTNQLNVTDVIPVGLQIVGGNGGFTFTNSPGVTTGVPVVILSGINTYTINFGQVNVTQAGNITINYLATVLDILGNFNGINLINNATLFYLNSTGQTVNGGISNATVRVVEPNLSINKTASKTNLVIGEEFTYRIFVTHTGTSTSNAYNVTISDTIPNGLTYVTGSAVLPVGWSLNVFGNVLTFSTPVLNLTTYNATLLFNCTVDNNIMLAGQNKTNTANITYTSIPTGGRTYGPTDSSVQVHILGADILVTKTGTSSVHAGQGISYTVTIRNLGPDTAVNVTFTDTFIASWFSQLINPQYSLNGGTYNNINVNPWILSLGDIISDNSSTVDIIATISPSAPAGVLNNTANATSSTTDPNPNNNNDTKLTTVDTIANLTLNKNNNPSGTVIAGTNLVYTLLLINTGPSVAREVIFRDALDNWLIDRSFRYSLDGGVSWSSWTSFTSPLFFNASTVLPMGYLDVLRNVTVEINSTVDPTTLNGTVINNTANVTSSTSPFEVISNEVTNNVDTRADLTLSKSNNPSGVVLAGNNLVYTMDLTNTGPSVARDVIFRDDALSSWFINRYYRYSVNGGSWLIGWTSFSGPLVINVTNTTIFSAGYMGVGENFTVEINSTVNASTLNGTVINNTANVISSTSPFEVISNEVSNTVETMADLEITKVADVEKIIRGYPIHYTIVITNLGPSDVLNVNFYDEYAPQLLENTFYSTSNGITWTAYINPLSILPLISVLAPGENVTIWINGTVALNATHGLTNNATTNSETDPAGNKTATVNTPIQTSDVTIQKTVSNPRPYIHETIFFTLILQNNGPDTAIDVYVIDKLPAGVRYVSHTANYGTYDPATGYWVIGNLPKGIIAELVITCVVEKLGPIENHAHVYTASYDPILDNQSATASLYVLAAPNKKTIPMRNTGAPMVLLVMAVLLIAGGIFTSRKK